MESSQAPPAIQAHDPGPVPLTLGVTAHRDLRGDEQPGIEKKFESLFQSLEQRYPDLPLRLITPLADGGDRIAARVARARGIELVVPLPFAIEEYEKDFSRSSRKEFRSLLDGALVIDLSLLPDHMEAARPDRDQGYARAGVWTSDHCHILVAIWDGRPSYSRGGTADVVDYHQFGVMSSECGGTDKRDSVDLRGLAPDDSDLIFHIVCSRNRPNGQPAEGLEPGSSRWLITNPQRSTVADIPVRQHTMFRRIASFNRDQQKLRPDSSLERRLPGWRNELAKSPDLRLTATYFSRADLLAARFRRRYRLALAAVYLLAALMGVAFIAYADLNRPSMIAAYLALFFVGWVVYRLAEWREWHRKFLDYRALAEGLRVQFYWRMAGVSGQFRNDFASDNFLQKQDLEIGWIRNVMRYAGTPLTTPGDDRRGTGDMTDASVDEVIQYWIGAPGGKGQLGYFESRCKLHLRHVRRTDQLVKVTLWLGIAITVLLALFQRRLDDAMVTGMVAAMGILPLAAAVREAYSHKVAEKELLKQYQFMLDIYRAARFRLDHCRTVEEKRGLLRALGEAALDEHAEWILIHRERPLEPGKL